jgi:hypothetical protein
MSVRSQSKPLRSIFSHSAGVSRIVRCTKCSSGGFGGLPRGRFCSMPRTVAPIYEDSNNPCTVDLSDYNKSTSTGDSDMSYAASFQNLIMGQPVGKVAFLAEVRERSEAIALTLCSLSENCRFDEILNRVEDEFAGRPEFNACADDIQGICMRADDAAQAEEPRNG